MPDTFAVNITGPITSVKVLDDYRAKDELCSHSGSGSAGESRGPELEQELQAQKDLFAQVCQTLETVIVKLNDFYDGLFGEHKEQIAKLSVEIARKILVQKVKERDYEIESIVKEAFQNAPTHQDVVVHLNPEDLAQYQKIQSDSATDALAGIKFVSDAGIGPAECMLETGKGVIESLIDEQLEKISKSLAKVN